MGILGSFLGTDQRKDILRGARKAQQRVEAGRVEADAQDRTGLEQANAILDPFANPAAQTLFDDAIGLGGADAAEQAAQTLSSNPLFRGNLATDSNAVLRNLNAQGAGGGKLALAGQRVFNENIDAVLNRLANRAGRAGQFSGQQSINQLNTSNRISDRGFGVAGTLASNDINTANAVAASRSIPFNNLIGLGKVAASFI